MHLHQGTRAATTHYEAPVITAHYQAPVITVVNRRQPTLVKSTIPCMYVCVYVCVYYINTYVYRYTRVPVKTVVN